MADPTEGISGIRLHRITETTSSITDSAATNLDTGNAEKIELVNKGPNTVYFRCDGTTPTAGASGNADQITSGSSSIIEKGKITDVKMICDSGESATVFSRLYS